MNVLHVVIVNVTLQQIFVAQLGLQSTQEGL